MTPNNEKENIENEDTISNNDNIVLVRLISGEELICTASLYKNDEGEKFYKLQNPSILMHVPGDTGKLGVSIFMPYANNQDFITSDRNVMFILRPFESLIEKHKEIHSSLVLPPNKKIIT